MEIVVLRKGIIDETSEHMTVPNALIHDRDLSFEARGLILTMLATPEATTLSDIEKLVADDRDTIVSAMLELEQLGYLEPSDDSGWVVKERRSNSGKST